MSLDEQQQSRLTKSPEHEPAWRALSIEWEASGDPQQKFCERKGVSYSTFIYWRSYFLSQKSRTQPLFREVTLRPRQV